MVQRHQGLLADELKGPKSQADPAQQQAPSQNNKGEQQAQQHQQTGVDSIVADDQHKPAEAPRQLNGDVTQNAPAACS